MGGLLVLLIKSLFRTTLLKGAFERRARNLYNYKHMFKIKYRYTWKYSNNVNSTNLDQEPQVDILALGLFSVHLTVLVVSDVDTLQSSNIHYDSVNFSSILYKTKQV